ncbi:HesB/YadR/YfhF family protein [Aerococcus viridans]|uniref:HesB/YadR/YfhF family protein n=1 Tax=Aerococcus viridans TaxID=1377 RepID=UPI00223B116C|nr:iron-sulfur cluster biosynthesis protein [Aerococcus viridans]MCT1798311.1 iron-sulfur cluster biosynthesis protein [Aerococcus viridans]
MKLTITPAAQAYFKNDMGLSSGCQVGFHSRVYGKTAVHEGFSVGLSIESPGGALLIDETIDGIQYYITENDDWFFNGYDFEVDFSPEEENFIYRFIEQ